MFRGIEGEIILMTRTGGCINEWVRAYKHASWGSEGIRALVTSSGVNWEMGIHLRTYELTNLAAR